MKIRQQINGFTLVEVMVAMVVVGLVFGVIITSSSALSRRSRDQQRVTDLQNIQQALAAYYADQHFYPFSYPPIVNIFEPESSNPLTRCTGNPAACPANPNTYLSVVPTEPSYPDHIHYCYMAYPSALSFQSDPNPNPRACDNVTITCQYYSLYANLETSSAPTNMSCEDHTNSFNYVVHPN